MPQVPQRTRQANDFYLLIAFYKVENELRGLNTEVRVAVRQAQSKPLIINMHTWLAHNLPRASPEAPLDEALKYIAIVPDRV